MFRVRIGSKMLSRKILKTYSLPREGAVLKLGAKEIVTLKRLILLKRSQVLYI
jgi:hypothetical protein